jgi:predicted RNase H-like HicB family nuclease
MNFDKLKLLFIFIRDQIHIQRPEAGAAPHFAHNEINVYEITRQTMSKQFILSAYIEEAIARAIYDKLEDNTYSGRIPECKGVIAFGSTLNECAAELRSTLEEWVVLGLKLGHPLPILAGIDLNKEPEIEPMETV